jgi:hypothetical protein
MVKKWHPITRKNAPHFLDLFLRWLVFWESNDSPVIIQESPF